MPDTQSPLVAILGPTAVGKTEMAIQIAEKLNGEIVSADSRLFYRGMDIGTAKPTLRDRSRVPHHLIDISNPDQIWSLAIFQQAAHQAINDIQKRHRLPLLVGGTGQYIRAVIEGWKVPAVEPAPALRKALQKWEEEIGPQELHLRLEILDPVAARNIDPRNVRRVIRALEVILCTGQLFSTQRIRQLSPYHTILLGLTRPRSELYTRIDERVNGMFAAGLVNEVYNLLQQGYSPDLPTLSAIGYKQVVAHLLGKISLDEAILLTKRQTRVLVRRQANWFKQNDSQIHWFTVQENTGSQIIELLEKWLKEDFKDPICVDS